MEKLLLVCCTIVTMLAGYFGWDGDGYYLRQVLLIYAGGMGAGILILGLKD
jgi:Na+/citrate or Na+/malate symporter